MRPTLTHLALNVPDLEAAIGFYEEYCELTIVHDRGDGGGRTVWLAEAGKEHSFVFVLIGGGPGEEQGPRDFSHIGFALDSKEAVDAVARKAESRGDLVWPPRQEPWPVAYFCGVRAPDGRVVEFSYGQPLGPGADSEEQRALP